MGPISFCVDMTGLVSYVIPRRLAAAGSGLSGGFCTGGCGDELLLTAIAAEVGGLPIAFGVEGNSRVHRHSADRVLGHGFRLAHGLVPFAWLLYEKNNSIIENHFRENRLIATINRTMRSKPMTVQSHIPPPSHPFMCPVD
jgi:hypothetical protein